MESFQTLGATKWVRNTRSAMRGSTADCSFRALGSLFRKIKPRPFSEFNYSIKYPLLFPQMWEINSKSLSDKNETIMKNTDEKRPFGEFRILKRLRSQLITYYEQKLSRYYVAEIEIRSMNKLASKNHYKDKCKYA